MSTRLGSVPALLGALVAVLLAGLPLSAARADGAGDPVIYSPSGAQPLYEGFTGPYRVDFGNAPATAYSYRVERLPIGEAPVVVDTGTFPSTPTTGAVSFTLDALPPAPEYRFVVVDDATGDHRDEVTFEVRAGAQPRCSVVVPHALRVNTAEEVVVGRLSSNCAAAGVDHASWDVKNLARGTYVNTLAFYDNSQDFWKFFDAQPLGTYVMKPVDVANGEGDDIAQNQPSTVVRLDSRLALSAVRDGTTVTLSASLRKYSRDANTFGPWGKHPVAFAYRTCSTCPWTYLQTVTTSLSGRATYRVRASTARTYRVTVGGTSTYWAAYPAYDRA